jgi:hypothetical protein
MSIVLNGSTGITTPDTSATTLTASTSVTTPLVTNAGTLALSATGANSITLATNGATRITATSGGNVGIGTGSPGASTRLEVVAGTGAQSIAAFRTGDATAANNIGGGFYGTSSATAGNRRAQIWLDADGADFSSGDYFYINKHGDNGIVELIQASNAALTFRTNNTERGQFTAGGVLLVGTTDASRTAGVGVKINPASYTTTPTVACVGTASTNAAADTYHVYSTGASAYRFYVGYGGTVFATNTTISAVSDARLKENIQDLDAGLDAVMALKPRKFDWKAGKGKDIKGDRGWIAQEFEQVFPDMVDEWRDPAPEGEEPYKSVRADLIPVLTKAIQEQQQLIESLTARIAALEGTE